MPDGFPSVVASLDEVRYGINSRGHRTLLSASHSTIINGESRSLVYPSNYPYTAVCKAVRALPGDDRRGLALRERGHRVHGRARAMVTSGHVQPPAGKPWHIQVIPGCWNGQSVFGQGWSATSATPSIEIRGSSRLSVVRWDAYVGGGVCTMCRVAGSLGKSLARGDRPHDPAHPAHFHREGLETAVSRGP